MRRTRRKPDKLNLNVTIGLRDDGTVAIDPQFNQAAVEHLDGLYMSALREDYDTQWTDDHKVAYFLADMIDHVLAQWGPPIDQEELDMAVPTVPHINEAPVRDRFDLSEMTPASRKPTN